MSHRACYEPVPVAVPRWWLKDWMLNLFHLAFGQVLGTKQPFRWLMFRELSGRERLAMLDKLAEPHRDGSRGMA